MPEHKKQRSRGNRVLAYRGAVASCVLLFALMFFSSALAGGPAAAPRITPQELKTMLDEGKVVILDVRSQGSYNASKQRIKNDVRMPLGEIAAKYTELSGDKAVVAYCT